MRLKKRKQAGGQKLPQSKGDGDAVSHASTEAIRARSHPEGHWDGKLE